MFGSIGTFVRNWFIIFATFVVASVMINGRDSLNGSFDLQAGFDATWKTYGSWAVLAVIVALTLLAIILVGFSRVQDTHYENDPAKKRSHQIGALIVIIAITMLVVLWIAPLFNEDPASFGAIFIALAVVTVSALAVSYITKPKQTPATPAAVTTTTP